MNNRPLTPSEQGRRNSARSPWRTWKPGWLRESQYTPPREPRK